MRQRVEETEEQEGRLAHYFIVFVFILGRWKKRSSENKVIRFVGVYFLLSPFPNHVYASAEVLFVLVLLDLELASVGSIRGELTE